MDGCDCSLGRVVSSIGRLVRRQQTLSLDVFRESAAMTRSTVLEMKLRFDIGRYEHSAAGSSVGFFNLGWMMACLSTPGKTTSDMDALHINAIVSANKYMARLTSQVGAGSSEQCLAGEQLTIFIISAVVTILIPDRALHGLTSMLGGGALDVAARITSTLFSK